ncbi:acyl-CoA synthetase [Achromobacter sp. Root170]|jgi:fatty-acyl-CoA synthase|uniref:acyl-CoA synthetase n=1 Tax=Achromobacter sp. Root170 TaxID=1736480 RepID=UPI0006FB240A|nr:acyl-CoA synthetase [Achromobacter sp. Root170]KRB17753.1 acyl-CoA synthetase [Achromobacter sp. Root170]
MIDSPSLTRARPIAAPFAAPFPVRTAQDVQRLQARPLADTLTVQSTYEIFCNSAAAFGDRRALTFLRSADPADDAISWTYRELLAGIHQTANLLHSLGIREGDAVGVLLPGCLEYHLALWGGEAAGIVQPLNPLLTDDKLASLMTTAGAKALIAYGSDVECGSWSKALRLMERVPTLKTLLRVAPWHEAEADRPALPDFARDFNAARAAQPADRLVSERVIRARDVAAYFHTGGTTGAPKLAIHTHANQVFSAWAAVQLQNAGPGDVVINGYPLFHVAGVLPASLAALSAGVETVIPTTLLLRNRDVLRNYWRLVEKHRATSLQGVPTILAALAEVPLDGADISSLRYCRTGAAPLPAELAARFKRLFGLHVSESLGMTEMAGITSISPPGCEFPVNCVGFPLPYVQVRIVGLDMPAGQPARDLPAGTPGMVLIKAPNVIPGFLDPADTAHAFTEDGWLISGDVGFMDAEGRLHLQGRAKDLIIRGGHNIDPKTIEDALATHPAVQLCAAVGAPDAYAGELPIAFVTLAEGREATEAELVAYAAAHVDEGPARPKRVVILDSMPMTNVGKIYKPDLRRLATAVSVETEVARTLQAAGRAQDDPVFRVLADAQPDVAVEAGAGAPAPLIASLREALSRLPVKVDVRD